ncbi:hypothetical protein PT974_07986 [Cladobotryum mycophilum]|uniref:Mid2 domain-containing protein n=1 Tax=Cladobotryum mycophilum TaxID=491253 RepID=A0ABR0SC21_9HYPO
MLLPETTPAPVADSLEIRQAFRVVTQTLIRQSTTITTTLTLGSEIPTSSPAPLTTPTAAPPPPAAHHHHHPHLTGGQVAGILCGVIGLVVILLIVGIFYINTSRLPITYEPEKDNKSQRTNPSSYRYVEEIYYTSRKKKKRRSSSSVEPLQRPPPVVERVPGGPKFPTYRALPISNPRNPQAWRVG